VERSPAGPDGEGRLIVSVSDDGRGLAGAGKQGLGQLGMRERVASLGGVFHCEQGMGQGVRITAIIPIFGSAEQ